jgi:hypothetical protein
MTLFGKILVLLNVTLSLLMAAWAIGVYSGHMHWGIDKSIQESEYQVNQLRERLAPSGKGFSLYDDMTSAEARWTPSSGRFQALEPIWAKNQKWYDDQMGELKTSAKAVKMASYKAGQAEVRDDPQNFGLPVMVDATDKGGKALTGLDPYKKEYDDKQAAIKTAMDDLAKLIVEDKDLTEKIGGKEGLRVQLDREAEKKRGVLAEQDYIKPLLVNSLVEGELLQKRRADLEARVKELRATPVASSR